MSTVLEQPPALARALATLAPSEPRFESLSVILPVMNETTSLLSTVEQLVGGLGTDLGELIVVWSPRTTGASREAIERLGDKDGPLAAASRPPGVAPPRLVLHEQHLPFLGGAMREAFELASCSHVVMMASDLETDPATVPEMVRVSKARPDAVVTASRWMGSGGGRFEGYNPAKLVLNAVFQHLFKLLYRTELSDLTYGFRLFPTWLVRSIAWEELRHPFLFETLIKPLRLGVAVIEVPTQWKSREEGASSNSFFANFAYARTGLQMRRRSAASCLRPARPSAATMPEAPPERCLEL